MPSKATTMSLPLPVSSGSRRAHDTVLRFEVCTSYPSSKGHHPGTETLVRTTAFLLQDRLGVIALLTQLIKGLEVFVPETTQLSLLRFLTEKLFLTAQSTAIFPQPITGPQTCQNTGWYQPARKPEDLPLDPFQTDLDLTALAPMGRNISESKFRTWSTFYFIEDIWLQLTDSSLWENKIRALI